MDKNEESAIDLGGQQGIVETVETTEVPPIQVFKLAKSILFACAIFFVLTAATRIIHETEATKEIWEYTKLTISSLSSLVLGLYFGRKGI
jgi:hypothetical protein